MKRPRRIAAGLTAVLLLSLTACGGAKTNQTDGESAAQTRTFGAAVQVQRVAAESIATDNKVSGRVLAEDEATVMVGVSAKCVAVYRDAGDAVREGDVLCKLDLASTLSQYNASQISYESAIQQYNDQKAILDQQVSIAEKGVATAQQQIAVQKQQIAAQEQQIAAQEANLPVQEQQIANAEANLPVTERQIANAEANLPVTEQQIANAEAGIPIQEQQLEAAQEQFAAQEANIPVQEQQLALAESQLALARKNVSDTEALFQIGAASQMEVDNAKITANQLEYQRDQLRVALSNAEAQLSLSRAQIASQKTALENTRTQIEAQKVGLENTRTQIEAQKVGLENTRTQIEAQKVGLQQSKAAIEAQRVGLKQSKAAIEAARVQVEQLKLALSQAESQLASARLGVEQAKSSRASALAQMEAGIESARSGVQQLNSVLEDVDDDGNVIAPISGTLVTFNAVENSYISNAMPVAVIHGENEMKVTASVSEALVPKLKTGDSADIYVSALNRSMKALIRSVERAANAQTRLYTVTLTLTEPVTDLLAGMFADVTFHTDRVNNAIVIPSEAILTSGETQYVYIAVGDKAKYVEVKTGLTGTGVTEILSGLDGGEYLIVVGQTYVSDGADIRIVGEK